MVSHPTGGRGTRNTLTRSNLSFSHLVSCSCRAGPPSAAVYSLLWPALSAAVYPQPLSLSESHQFWLINYSPDNTYLPGQPPPDLIARLICLQSTVLTRWLLTANAFSTKCSLVQYFSWLLTYPNTPTHHTPHTYIHTHPPTHPHKKHTSFLRLLL